MSKLKISEIFGPAGYWEYRVDEAPIFHERWGVTQGEGKYVGQRSVFIRTFGCNFRCPSFGLPKGQCTTEPQEFAKNIKLYKSIVDVPAAKYGCDSYYSVYPEFKSLSPAQEVAAIAEQALKAAGGSFFQGSNPIHLILTGGEPMLGWQKYYHEIINAIREMDPNWKGKPWLKLRLTIETNGTQKLVSRSKDPHHTYYLEMLWESCYITWSISPKLTDTLMKRQSSQKLLSLMALFLMICTSSLWYKMLQILMK